MWRYRRFSQGVLEEPGGLGDQPAKLVQLLQLIEATVNLCEAGRRREEEEKRLTGRRG